MDTRELGITMINTTDRSTTLTLTKFAFAGCHLEVEGAVEMVRMLDVRCTNKEFGQFGQRGFAIAGFEIGLSC
jgi:hypothetical protein